MPTSYVTISVSVSSKTEANVSIDDEKNNFSKSSFNPELSKICIGWAMDIVRLIESDSQDSNKIIKELVKIGRKITRAIINKKNGEEFKKFFKEHPNVDIKILSDCWIPWELLYLDNNEEIVEVKNFLGYKRNIYRLAGKGVPYENKTELAVGFFAHERVPSVSEEHKILECFKGATIKYLNWQKVQYPDGWLQNLNILHFAGLITSFKYYERANVLIGDDLWLPELRKEHKERDFNFSEHPLVVLNVRDNYFRNPKHIFNLAKVLREKEAGAVIASEFPIPTELAKLFTEKFYGHLFKGKQSIGQALATTKNDIIDQHPFIMFYVPYFEPLEDIEEPISNNGQKYITNQNMRDQYNADTINITQHIIGNK